MSTVDSGLLWRKRLGAGAVSGIGPFRRASMVSGRHKPVYRGPDRRGADRTPPPIWLEAPGGRFWRKAVPLVVVVVAVAVFTAVFTTQGLNHAESTAGVLQLFQRVTAVLGGLAFLMRWRITGEAPVALLGLALIAGWLSQLPVLIVDPPANAIAGPISVPARTAGTILFLWFLVRAVRTTPVDSGLRPLRTAVAASVCTGAVLVTLEAAQHLRGVVLTFEGTPVGILNGLLGAALLTLAWVYHVAPGSVPSPVSTRVAVVLVGLALSHLLREALSWSGTPREVVSVVPALMALIALFALVLVATAMLRSALESHATRLLSLRLRTDFAEEAVRRDQEQMHELRATVTGLCHASATLQRLDRHADPGYGERLEQMFVSELARLKRLLAASSPDPGDGPVMLDQVIGPLVLCQREAGLKVHWRPRGLAVLAGADQTAQILNILLTNARTHACGAEVEISARQAVESVLVTVRDNGPGMPPTLADRAFERGVRGPESEGSGLGLFLARRLAADQGGAIELVRPQYRTGATFVLTLRSATSSHHLGAGSHPLPSEVS